MFASFFGMFTAFFNIFGNLFSAAERYSKLLDDISKNHGKDIKAEHELNSLKRKAAIDKARAKVGLTSDNANAFKAKLQGKAKAD